MRGWRPIPAALHPPIRPSLFRGGRPSLSPTGQNFPDEAVSIGKATSYVKRKSIRKSGKHFEFPSLPLVLGIQTVQRGHRRTGQHRSKGQKSLFYNWLQRVLVSLSPKAISSRLIPLESHGDSSEAKYSHLANCFPRAPCHRRYLCSCLRGTCAVRANRSV